MRKNRYSSRNVSWHTLIKYGKKFSFVAIVVAFCSLIFTFIQIRLLRKNIETSRYYELLGKLFSVRDNVIDSPQIARMFHANPQIKKYLKAYGVSMREFFWLLKYLRVLENFYYHRERGVMHDQTWIAYVAKVKLVFSTPKIRKFWKEYHSLNTYRTDWTNFVDAICEDKSILWEAKLSRCLPS